MELSMRVPTGFNERKERREVSKSFVREIFITFGILTFIVLGAILITKIW